MIKVLLADDHTMVRAGLKQIIEEHPGMEVAAEADDGDKVIAILENNKFDILIMDIKMPGKPTLDVIKQVRILYPELQVLMLTMYSEEQFAMRFLKAGARGYMTKDTAPEELIIAIKKIAGGGKYLSAALAEKIAFEFTGDTSLPHTSLSDREFQVMLAIASGKPPKAIADELCLSIKTISTYRSRILQKMNLKNNSEIMHYAMHHALID
jgi:two-component system, NarL family, invasion response regulator UvrY